MSDLDYDKKINLFKDMSGWGKMCDALTDIDPEDREAYMLKFINVLCGLLI